MSRTIEVSDEEYAALERAAKARGQTVPALLRVLIDAAEVGSAEGRHYETDDWLRRLGVSEERIRQANERHAARYGTDDWLRHLGLTDEDIAAVKREVREEAETLADTQ
jgi:hypothetical protein